MSLPPKQGLYDPANEHDSCGIGFVAHIKGRKSHDIIRRGLNILVNLDHRGAVGADPLVGDGAGILIQMPDALMREEASRLGVTLPAIGSYAVGMFFMPRNESARAVAKAIVERFVAAEGQTVLGWREVPVDRTGIGTAVLAREPYITQLFVARGPACVDTDAFERKLFVARKQIENAVRDLVVRKQPAGIEQFYIPSLSSRTIVYKGLLLAHQVGSFYADLRDERLVSALALVHQRFSTNTFPSWRLAHPYRMICHNGEINTVRGNQNWMAARRHSIASDLFGDDMRKLWPLILPGQSDTACFDNSLELLVQGGYPLAHAMMMMIPEAWAGNPLMGEKRRAFYEYHAALMEPWDGPAAIAFTDGRQIGATLDRNGLRPARYIVTDDDLVVLSSEVGVSDVPDERIVKKWRLQPGKMLLIDLEAGKIVDDSELRAQIAGARPYQEWLSKTQIVLEDLPPAGDTALPDPQTLLDRQQAFGYTQEDLNMILEPMAGAGEEAIGSMGTDTPPAVLSRRPTLLYKYFKQNFAQVTNPPIDSIREELVMSLVSLIGPRPNLLGHGAGTQLMRLEVRQPILTNKDLEKIRGINKLAGDAFRTVTLDVTYPASEGPAGMEPALDTLCSKAIEAVKAGYNILILSDRAVSAERAGVPALLATSAVHHHLIREGLRTEAGLVVETGEAREVHHFCVLAGYGAEAVNPYVAFETLEAMRQERGWKYDANKVRQNYIKAVGKGMLKVMAKMGISTYQSYCGAQIFDAVGLSTPFIERYFTGTATTVEGAGLTEIAAETLQRHALAFGDSPVYRALLDVGGEYGLRLRGEEHMWTPDVIANLQHAVRGDAKEKYKAYAALVNGQ
ncbi:MAG: glutamate synthase subunit alpha, partial [Alphaproteobacteria bacterium]|nr:glutamate synthase subunit alpha [Alphaproteobacteria bacterium]